MTGLPEQGSLADTAYAKINLALHVRGRLADGYHRIETLFAFCEDGDALSVFPSDDLRLEIGGPFGEGLGAGEDNLVLRAARALAAETRNTRRGAVIRLDKRLPIASGIGGGSADAAATLRLLAGLWDIAVAEETLLAIASRLGADVPACLRSTTVRGGERGDMLSRGDHDAFGGTPVLLVNPGVRLSTAAVFAGWDGVDRGALPSDPAFGRNDLESSAIALQPEIASVLRCLTAEPGTSLVRMSGSGATCFALFADAGARDAARAAMTARAPSWWQLASTLR